MPVAFGNPPEVIPWPGIHYDLFVAETEHVALEPGWRGRLALRRTALWDRARKAFGAGPGAAEDEYLGLGDAPANLVAATPDPAIVTRVVEAQRRLAVSTRARRAGLAVLSVIGVLLAIASLFTARYFRNLPVERRDAARATLNSLGFRVTDDRRTNYRLVWDTQDPAQGPLSDDVWRQAAGPLQALDRYADIADIELIYTDVTDLLPLAGLTTVRTLKLLGCKADDLSPIAGMTRLESLVLSDFPHIDDDDLRVVRNFGRLSVLYLTHCPRLTDRVPGSLAGLPVRELVLSDCRKIDNRGLASLSGLPLEQLMINRTGARIDRDLVDLLLSFPRLKSVNVGGLHSDASEQRRLWEQAGARGLRVSPRLGASAHAPSRPLPSPAPAPQGEGPSPPASTLERGTDARPVSQPITPP